MGSQTGAQVAAVAVVDAMTVQRERAAQTCHRRFRAVIVLAQAKTIITCGILPLSNLRLNY